MTDEAESRVDGRATGEHAPGGVSETPPNDASGTTSDAAPDSDDSHPDRDIPVDFGDLSLPQRIFVAAVQNPTRGVVIVGLFAFAFSFYVAFWMVFPRVAAFLSGIGAVLVAIVAAVYLLSNRFLD